MRLLNTSTLIVTYFMEGQTPSYVILSHTWGPSEVTFQDIQDLTRASQALGFAKIRKCCDQAFKDGFEWAWIDTCCIDKSSSAELSESINSMFKWYRESKICYAFLEDVPYGDGEVGEEFRKSRWFTRGWTLQELIAPLTVEFYSKEWKEIGTKLSLKWEIAEITRVDVGTLSGASLSDRNVAERMSWAAYRNTARSEDIAYSLMGIFDVNMPMLYGEGGVKAFIRLQEEIMRKGEDFSLFAWTDQGPSPKHYSGLLAESPNAFRCPEGQPNLYSELLVNPPMKDEYLGMAVEYMRMQVNNPLEISSSITNRGLRISFSMRSDHLAYLNCRRGEDEAMLCIVLERPSADMPYHYSRICSNELKFVPVGDPVKFSHTALYVREFPDPDEEDEEDGDGLDTDLSEITLAERFPCEFVVAVDGKAETAMKTGKAFPSDNWDDVSHIMKYDSSCPLMGAVELLSSTNRLVLLFGMREGTMSEPWCDLLAGDQLSEEVDVEKAFRTYEAPNPTRLDRVKKVVKSGDRVAVSARKVAARLQTLADGKRADIERFVLNISMN
jgi:hypothetical protein